MGLTGCLVRDEHSEPSQKEEFGNSSDVGLPGCLVHDKHSEPSRKKCDSRALVLNSGSLSLSGDISTS